MLGADWQALDSVLIPGAPNGSTVTGLSHGAVITVPGAHSKELLLVPGVPTSNYCVKTTSVS